MAWKPGKPVAWLIRLVFFGVVAWIGYIAPPWKYWAMWLSAVGWIAFSSYWGVAARNSAEAKTSESRESRRVHEVLTNVALFFLFLPIPGLRGAYPPPAPVWQFSGLGVQAASVALAVWSRRHLGRNWSGRIEIKQDHELIRTGPYRWLRHPIYTALLGMYAGTALIDGHVHALAGVAVGLFAYWRKVRLEEANLRTAFGHRYDAYRSKTWGAVPGFF